MQRSRLATLILLSVPLSFAAALYFGSVSFSAAEWRLTLSGEGGESMHEILWHLRAPRAASAFACGALLALAGALLQVLLRNPLADPYILGVSGGASVGALGGMWFGLSAWALHGLAFGGAALSGLALLAFSASFSGWQIHRVMLTGVGIAAGCSAIVALILSLAPSGQLHGMLFWLMGDLSFSLNSWPAYAVLLGLVVLSQWLALPLDALSLGDLKAASLGIAVRRTRTLAFLAAIIATVAAVLLAGAIGFVGLVVPHLLRLGGISEHRWLLPLSTAAGGALLVLADTAARSIAAPLELPVGAMTALIGVPVLLVLLAKTR